LGKKGKKRSPGGKKNGAAGRVAPREKGCGRGAKGAPGMGEYRVVRQGEGGAGLRAGSGSWSDGKDRSQRHGKARGGTRGKALMQGGDMEKD